VNELDELAKRLKDRSPSKRLGEPEELRGAVLFLASDASKFVVGQNIQIDGGWTLW
jgi:gluconate 5-dehydrogenase